MENNFIYHGAVLNSYEAFLFSSSHRNLSPFHFTCSTHLLTHTTPWWTFPPVFGLHTGLNSHTAHDFCTSTPDSRSKRTESETLGSQSRFWCLVEQVLLLLRPLAKVFAFTKVLCSPHISARQPVYRDSPSLMEAKARARCLL